MMSRTVFPLVLIANVLVAARAQAEDNSCIEDCGVDFACVQSVVVCLFETDRARDAVDYLKLLNQSRPEDLSLTRLLASAYLANDNTFWAERTLLAALERHSGDCETVSWLVWVYLSSGDLSLARETLDTAGCPSSEADHSRWHLLMMYVAMAEKDNDAAKARIRDVGEAKRAYAEDRDLWEFYHRQENPGWIDPVSLRAEIWGGFTSNARAGSPSDTTGEEIRSALGRFALFSRFVAPASKNLRPAVEGELRGHGLPAPEVRDLSYLDLSLRPGVILGDHLARLLLTYKANLLLIGLEGKERYYESHRGELEFETHFGLLVFAGAGRRLFRESGRTRTELDLGIGGSVFAHRRVQLFFALSGRRYWAIGDAYDQVGGTALVAGLVNLEPGVSFRLGVTPVVDHFPHSGGERGSLAYGTEEKRFDVLVKQFDEVWSPPLKGFRIGLRYEFSWRDSTADSVGSDYDFTEHRVLGGIRWSLNSNPFGPKAVSSKGHVALPFGIEEQGAAFDEERIQDLLRQDEATRSGSACVD